jgi:A/G-specific adenine glycosylase
MVSEVMLQQTQVARVIPKYVAFLAQFPTPQALAAAPLGEVIKAWSGLGYNRRAKFLWQAAAMIGTNYGGVFPSTSQALVGLPGVGVNTAGAILAYAYDSPVAFIETNIRTVYIHHFFPERDKIADAELRPVIEATLPRSESSREWYWALMDYGSYLKQTVGNVSRTSKSYAKQSKFEGSRRQLRGLVIRELTGRPHSLPSLAVLANDERLGEVLADLVREDLVVRQADMYHLA